MSISGTDIATALIIIKVLGEIVGESAEIRALAERIRNGEKITEDEVREAAGARRASFERMEAEAAAAGAQEA
jgi:hypothetical protein